MSSSAARLRVRVQPRASENAIVGLREGVLMVRVTAPPAGGQANEAVRKLIARRLRVGVSHVVVAKGAAAREKLLLIEGFSTEDLGAALDL